MATMTRVQLPLHLGLCLISSLALQLCGWPMRGAAQAADPLPQAHAHNDYLHARPLLDALAHGFCSVEADIYLVDGQLLVAHEAKELKAGHTLQKLYLDPLAQRAREHGGHIYPNGPTFRLLIDIKSEASATYRALHDVLSDYANMLTTVDKRQVKQGAVDVVISGNRPHALVASQSVRYCGIDGRLSDLDSDQPAHLLPMISDNWTLHFTWRGAGEISEPERQKLKRIVESAHAKQRVVRFWATPDDAALWRVLVDEKVDLINTDDLAGLATFLRSLNAAANSGRKSP